MTRIIFIISALAAPFFFPASISILLAACAAFFVPFMALAVGILHDMLYLAPGHLPSGIIIGIIGTLVALMVRRFVETRIIGG